MKQDFNNKYQDYYRSMDTTYDIFIMILGENESLDDYGERFQLSYKRAYYFTVRPKSLKIVLLRGVREDINMETLNLLANGDIYHLTYDEIKWVFKNHLRATRKNGRVSKSLVSPSSSILSKNEI